MPSLETLLRDRRILVCCGPGGVGKTTLSATLGLAAAAQGRRVMVCTIDPAKRLANALGVAKLDNEARRVDLSGLHPGLGDQAAGGELWAMMLDIKRTFDRLVEQRAPNPEVAQRILSNNVYQQLSGQLAGSQEYMAMEKLFELYASDAYDLIVLDTPPTKHALDFLHAPRRLSTFLEGSVLKWFLLPVRSGASLTGIAARVGQKVISWLNGVFGMRLLEELSEFFPAFEPLWGGPKARAEEISSLMARPDIAAFCVVTSPAPHAVTEALYFEAELRKNDLPLGGFFVNRTHPIYADQLPPGPLLDALNDGDENGADPATREALLQKLAGQPALQRATEKAIDNLAELEAFARHERSTVEAIDRAARAAGAFAIHIPALRQDVHDLDGLAEILGYLVDTPARDRAEATA